MAIKYVWRVDSRTPEEIFQHGFSGRGSDRNFFRHILGTGFRNDFFISTSETPTAAIRFFGSWLRSPSPETGRTAYLYQIRADERVYNARRTGENLYDLVMSNQIVHESGDRGRATVALDFLRTSFAYQREWFSDGPINGNQVRSAWRLDTVSIDPDHIHHPVGRVVESTRINDPEIMNDRYVDAETTVNEEPWLPTNPAQMATLLTPPTEAAIADVSGGVSSSLAFACPSSKTAGTARLRRSTNRKDPDYDECIAETIDCYTNLSRIPSFAPSMDEMGKTEIFLVNRDESKTFRLSGVLGPNQKVYLTENSSTAKTPPLYFFHDSYGRIVAGTLINDSYFEFALTLVPTSIAGQFQIKLQLAVTNEPLQNWLV
ncbi:hypothetical protein J2Z62_000085 [Mycoplasmoides fastidiosum]|uniref:Uncharacterized protein n=1 Tax=Mycoplasmoides fastidiosum TaxID=92758 RepID=A0ABU0LY87_9BACT|nr:hypothetical protein [Mycoplasmoides fastidiosum]MDQ0513647.1 hypothetical protein [Mycoplasmoides fastidiosum]UUD37933.1 hypothetical protein NPA10_00860 [Mycoplasmoides fastidiosum]